MAEWAELRTDEELYEEAVSGDKKCAGLLLSRYRKRLYNLAMRLVRDPQLAQDFVQETFLNTLSTMRPSLAENQFKIWAYAIVLNLCRTHIRKVRKLTEPQETETEQPSRPGEGGKEGEEAPSPPAPDSSDETLNTLIQAIAELPERQQEVILLSKYERLSYEDIGHLLGCSTGAIKALVFRGMEPLRNRMSEKP